jgi:ABC-type ATPase involved in cell division
MELLLAVAKEENTAILMATHDMQMVRHYPGRILEVLDGHLVEKTTI